MVDVLNTKSWSPDQAILQAQGIQEDMKCVAIAYMQKGEEFPRLTCSSMKPVDMYFLGGALQQYALETMRD